MKKIAILGCTGSIGESTLKVARHLKEKIKVVALAAHSNIDLLEQQAKEFHPELVAVFDEKKAVELKKRLPNITVEAGIEGLKAVASYSGANFVVSAISGTAGLIPTIAALEAGKPVGLANKEALVAGGALVMALAKQKGVPILPIDSEHSALFQCLNGESKKSVHRLILTASGGPFRNFTSEQLQQITPEQALKHPTWAMGPKVTIDCSTLMNKGLEVIEAHWLFDIPVEKISVVIHPQSVIHSMVEFVDNSLLAQMGETSMIVPIQYAITYPERLPGLLKPFDFTKYNTLQFLTPDTDKFRCLQLAFDAISAGGSAACYMNAANEVLVNGFLEKKIPWMDISKKLESLIESHALIPIKSIDDVIAVDTEARRQAASVL
jgi:1-deoxy-D-xylulose-5-phosphate reductoisomerase